VASPRSRIPKSPSTRFHTYGLALNELIAGIFAASISARVSGRGDLARTPNRNAANFGRFAGTIEIEPPPAGLRRRSGGSAHDAHAGHVREDLAVLG